MSEAAKKLPIEIKGEKGLRKYLVPAAKVKSIETLIKEYAVDSDDNALVSAEEVFEKLDKKYSKVGNILSGYRLNKGLTQTQLAKKIGSSQSAIASIENGKRKVGKAMATKLAKVFRTNFKSFL